jgi:predicted dehydrogenase
MDRIRIGVAGCGSVSEIYLPNLRECVFGEVVAVCDIVEERAVERKEEFGVAQAFPIVDAMLAGSDFGLLVNLTSMPSHFEVNKQALSADRHVFCEKPFAPTHDKGKDLVDLARARGNQIWAAPTTPFSPQFRCMAETIDRGEIGQVHAAHACYGHGGPSWGPWFYKQGGGCVGDLAVYSLTTLTGLLGPARNVYALQGTGVRERVVEDETVLVAAEDNAMILLDHGEAVFSHIQTGFIYGAQNSDRTIELIGNEGALNLLGFDWGPRGVEILGLDGKIVDTRCRDDGGYKWESGAARIAEFLATEEGRPMCIDHALHVVDVMAAARESASSGRAISTRSTFQWPISFDGGAKC